jgi:hypothetical protein
VFPEIDSRNNTPRVEREVKILDRICRLLIAGMILD